MTVPGDWSCPSVTGPQTSRGTGLWGLPTGRQSPGGAQDLGGRGRAVCRQGLGALWFILRTRQPGPRASPMGAPKPPSLLR